MGYTKNLRKKKKKEKLWKAKRLKNKFNNNKRLTQHILSISMYFREKLLLMTQ